MTELAVPRNEAKAELEKRIEKGQEILNWSIASERQLEETEGEFYKWSDYNAHLLERLFSDASEASKYKQSLSAGVVGLPVDEQIKFFRSDVSGRIRKLESYVERLHLFPVAANAISLHEPSSNIPTTYDSDQIRLKVLRKVDGLCRERENPSGSISYEEIADTPQEGNEFLALVDEKYINAKPKGASKTNPYSPLQLYAASLTKVDRGLMEPLKQARMLPTLLPQKKIVGSLSCMVTMSNEN